MAETELPEGAPGTLNEDHMADRLERRVAGLRQQNAKMMHQLAQNGMGVDLATARVEFLMGVLQELGIVTRLQRIQEQEAWEMSLRAQLQQGIAAAKQQVMAQGGTIQEESGLILPGRGFKV